MINKNINNHKNDTTIGIKFIIFDEAHVMEGDVNKKSGFGLYITNVPIMYRFFSTATPHNYADNPKQLGVRATQQQSSDGGRQIVPTTPMFKKGTKPSSSSATKLLPTVQSFSNEELFGRCIVCKTHRKV